MLSLAAFYVQRLFGEPLRQIASQAQTNNRGPTDAAVSAVSVQINQRINSLTTSLLPPVMTLETKTEKASGETTNFGNLFLPGLLVMSLLFAAQTIGGDIWIEHERGTLRRALTMPQPLGSFLAGKMIAGVGVMALLVSVALAVGVIAFGVSPSRVPLALVWTCFAGFALLTLLGCLQVFAKTARGGGMLATMLIFPLMMIGGSFFPFEIMPAWMQRVGQWTPNGLAVARLKEILFGAIDYRALGIAALAIGAAAIVCFLVGNWQTRRRFRTN
jgi:ABC-type multidrug transport system permease subunit